MVFRPPGIYVLLVYFVALSSLVWSAGQRMQVECILQQLGAEDAQVAGMAGLELAKASHKRLNRDDVHLTLALLEKRGYVRSERLDTCSSRRKYFITDKGKNYYMSLIGT